MNTKTFLLLTVALLAGSAGAGAAKKEHADGSLKVESTGTLPALLWRDPSAISARNLYYGPGGKEHEPHGTFTFVKEDLDGTSPKFVVRDDSGVKWKVKLGAEARPETAASRLVWSVGYFTNEDYFLPELQVQGLPAHLHRGQNFVEPGGIVRAVRLKRYLKNEDKTGTWHWREDPFTGTRELNGLRVLMAVINNWDLKDDNNATYEDDKGKSSAGPCMVYMISDLGASFGTTRYTLPHSKSKGNVDSYSDSKFITKVTRDYVSFANPSRPALFDFFVLPDFIERLRMEWIGRHIPREDAKWVGDLLAQLSLEQLRDAFRASGFSAEEVDGFAQVLQRRITALQQL